MAYTNIDDPSAYFQTAFIAGNITQLLPMMVISDLQPDLVWLKEEVCYNHHLYDSTRGVTKRFFNL